MSERYLRKARAANQHKNTVASSDKHWQLLYERVALYIYSPMMNKREREAIIRLQYVYV